MFGTLCHFDFKPAKKPAKKAIKKASKPAPKKAAKKAAKQKKQATLQVLTHHACPTLSDRQGAYQGQRLKGQHVGRGGTRPYRRSRHHAHGKDDFHVVPDQILPPIPVRTGEHCSGNDAFSGLALKRAHLDTCPCL